MAAKAGGGRPSLVRRLARNRLSMLGLAGVLVLVAIAVIGPFLSPYDPAALSPARLRGPSPEHWMGTENFGRDVFARFLYGTRVSMFVGVGAVAFALVLGTLVGMLAGLWSGSWIDTVLMRGVDVMLAFRLLV